MSEDEVYSWPLPGVKAERWRYMTIKECREALTKPVPSHIDPRARLKKCFMRSRDGLISALKAFLSDIVDLGPSDMQTIEHLSRKAVSTWLDFQMHRCRIVIRLKGPETESVEEKISLAQKSSSVLTVTPLLGRHGNVKGVELENFTIIAGCAGEGLKIP